AVDVFRDPEQRVQVSKPALALFDVWLELITAVADALVARVSLGKLAFNELRRSAAHDVGIKTLLQIFEESLLAPQIARLEQPSADRQIGFGLTQTFIDRARRLSDLQAKVPQKVEEILDDLLGVRGPFVGQQKQQVDVGIGGQLPAPTPADGDDR